MPLKPILWFAVLIFFLMLPLDSYSQLSNNQQNLSDTNITKFETDFYEKINNVINTKITLSDTFTELEYYGIVILVNNVNNFGSYDENISQQNKNDLEDLLINIHGAKDVVKGQNLSYVTAYIPIQEIPKLSFYDFVHIIGDGQRVANVESSYRSLNRVNALDLSHQGTDIIVSVMDNGITNFHPSLPINDVIIGQAKCEDIGCVDFTLGQDIIDNSDEDLKHGTHVAGIIASQSLDFLGIASHAKILNAKTINIDPTGTTINSSVMEIFHALDWSIQNGARVVNMSFGFGDSSDDQRDNCNSLIADLLIDESVYLGTSIITSAGNEGNHGFESITSPGCGYNSITVGNLNEFLSFPPFFDNISSTSSKGPSILRDGNNINTLKPEITAPGTFIISTKSDGDFGFLGLTSKSGTSMAAPFVSGASAILYDAHPEWSPIQVKNALLLGAEWKGETPYTASQYEIDIAISSDNELNKWGFGILDIGKSLENYAIPDGHIVKSTILQDQTKQYSFTLGDENMGKQVKVILSWLVPTISVSSSLDIQNFPSNLDLEIINPDGTKQISNSAHQNNEFVVFSAPQSGTYIITIKAPFVNSILSSQEFALGVTHTLDGYSNNKGIADVHDAVITPASELNSQTLSELAFTINPDKAQDLLTQMNIAQTTNTFSLESLDTSTLSDMVIQNQPVQCESNTIYENCVIVLDGARSYDPDGDDIISYSWDQTDGTSATVTLVGADTDSPAFIAPDVNGDTEIEFELEVKDDGTHQFSVPDKLRILVKDIPVNNNLPIAIPTTPFTTVSPNDMVFLDASESTDPDGQVLVSYNWMQTGGTSVILSDNTSPFPTFVAPNTDTTIEFELTVNDGLINSAPSSIEIIVSANQPPVARAGNDQTLDEGSLVVLDARSSYDPENQLLTYAWQQIDSTGNTISLSNPNSAVATFSAPLVSQDTTLQFQLTVNDGVNDRTDTVSIIISDVSQQTADFPLLPNPFPNTGDSFGAEISATASHIIVGAPQEDLVEFPDNLMYSFAVNNGIATFTNITTQEVSFVTPHTYNFEMDSDVDFTSLYITAQQSLVTIYDGTGTVLSASTPDPRKTTTLSSEIINDSLTVFTDSITDTSYIFGSNGEILAQEAQNAGAAYIFDTDGNLVRAIPNPSAGSSDYFGEAVSSVGSDGFVIGAKGADVGESNAGAAYLYDSITDTTPTTLLPQTSDSSDEFGYAVSSDGTIIVIGAPEAANGGTVTIFDVATGSRLHTIQNPVGKSGDDFGKSVTISNNYVIVGAPFDDVKSNSAGTVYLFEKTSSYPQVRQLTHTNHGSSDYFGKSLDSVNDIVLVGATGDGTAGYNSGSAYLFDGTTGDILSEFANPQPNSDDRFGEAVSFSDDYVIVGAYQDDAISSNSGSVYLFDRTSYSHVKSLPNPSPTSSANFGVSVHGVNDLVLTGAPNNKAADGTTTTGASYVFTNNDIFPPNLPPIAFGGNDRTVSEGTTVTLDGTGSADPEGESLSYTWLQTGGELVTLSGSTTATPSFTAPDVTSDSILQFSLIVNDSIHDSDADFISVTVIPVIQNTAPVANNDIIAQQATQQIPLTINTNTLLNNDLDADGDTITVQSVDDTSANGGTVTLSNNIVTYTSADSFTGDDTFSYTITDGTDTDSAVVTIAVIEQPATPEGTFVYVIDNYSKQLTKFDGDGNYLSTITGFIGPFDVDSDYSGNIYASATNWHKITKYNSNDELTLTIQGVGKLSALEQNGYSTVYAPHGVGIDESTGDIYSVTWAGFVQKFDSEGNYITHWGEKGSNDGQFKSPNGIAIDSEGLPRNHQDFT